jgi:hypothetical protein
MSILVFSSATVMDVKNGTMLAVIFIGYPQIDMSQ